MTPGETNSLGDSVCVPTQKSIIERMSEPGLWDDFFRYFICTVHPAEFALTDKSSTGSQRETALTATFHRVFMASGHLLGLTGWTSGMEAPFKRPVKDMAYVDITLFPWNGKGGAPWSIVNRPEAQVRIEVKWRDNIHFQSCGGVSPSTAMEAADENDSDQHFVLLLVFHGDLELPIHQTEGWNVPDSKWAKVAVFREKRRYAQFNTEYTHFSLVVLKRK